ncbi:glutathione S-transferase U9-like [Amaranthus tricolor]|uniref:glutathione S-transferase U9-like n=1 Tax=Amaranthus tricolor TaxID=29722 RepID=UPI0025845933|nr:glutathione S-transferase U9-like [Amaranthus tricolor]XP_057516128.1 glutathione S-transferase U9-like [Amaranthus tricolor]XP_057516129.1 glutathione S-transferase U9-like [Amaranthus tricolor]XP_057516130.1 glutathione S-transferase U9-like [Amaranthus tricolor]
MGEETTVSLHGMWASPYARWIKIALKIKGINYEYVEENLKKKSQILLRYNPIYKKVPLLIHDNNPIIESLVILQYIDDTWKVSQPLLPLDSYSRYIVRFWADFIINQLDMSLRKVITSEEIDEEMNIEEVKMKLNILEASMNTIFPYDPPSSCEEMRMLDILMCTLPTIIKGIEEAFNIKLMDAKEYPLIFSRMSSLSDLTVVKETAPSHEKMIKFYRAYRHLYNSK